jgi:hypothetical protein
MSKFCFLRDMANFKILFLKQGALIIYTEHFSTKQQALPQSNATPAQPKSTTMLSNLESV